MKHFAVLSLSLFSLAHALSSSRKDETLQKHIKMLKTVEQAKLSVRIKDILNSEDFQEAATNVIKVVAKHLSLPSEENAPGDAASLTKDKSSTVFPEQETEKTQPKEQIQPAKTQTKKPKELKPITSVPQTPSPRNNYMCKCKKKQFDLDGYIGKEEKNYNDAGDEESTASSPPVDVESSLKAIMAEFTKKVLEGVKPSSTGNSTQKPKGNIATAYKAKNHKNPAQQIQIVNNSAESNEPNVSWEVVSDSNVE